MAAQHVGKSIVVSLDLKDFFSSIKQGHLQAVFRHLGVGDKPSRLLSELCTYESFVPQGALTSPKVSNIVSSLTFGPIIEEYCSRRGYTLTIYADDITVSIEEGLTPENSADLIKELIRFVHRTVHSFGFRVNHKKTKVMRRNTRQFVCGVVVNERTNLQQKERRLLRAIVHNCASNGLEEEARRSGQDPEEFIAHIGGRLNWFLQLNPDAAEKLKQSFRLSIQQYRSRIEQEMGGRELVTQAFPIQASSGGVQENMESSTES
jgi:RNA-directed DNA polymerase